MKYESDLYLPTIVERQENVLRQEIKSPKNFEKKIENLTEVVSNNYLIQPTRPSSRKKNRNEHKQDQLIKDKFISD